MVHAVIVDAVRTPIGRAHAERGFYRETRSDDLAARCISALLDRNSLDPNEIEDCVLGNTQQTGEQGLNAARNIAIMAGLPVTTGGATVNRLCGSSLQAINQAAHSIVAGGENVQIVGGFEHMQHLPMDHGLNLNPKLFRRTSKGALHMGVTAEFLAQANGIEREKQDQFALRSHRLAAEAIAEGRWQREVLPTPALDELGDRFQADYDQCVRSETNMEALGKLSPAFMPKIGTVTAGNSSPLNDGASALLMMSDEKAAEMGLTPLVRVRSTAVAGVDPCVMGTGPVPATQKALKRAGLKLSDIEVIELNEAFAAQSIACLEMLDLDGENVNVRGGSIAIGHPLGASGARITTTLIYNMIEREASLGLATMCIGVGQGIATIFERV